MIVFGVRNRAEDEGSGCIECLREPDAAELGIREPCGPIDDEQPTRCLAIVGVQPKRLAEEDRSGIVLISSRAELAEQSERGVAQWIETDYIAQIRHRVEIATQRYLCTRANQSQRRTPGFIVESVRAHRHHTGMVTAREQLRGRFDDSSIHADSLSK